MLPNGYLLNLEEKNMSNRQNDILAEKAMEIVDGVLKEQHWELNQSTVEALYRQTLVRLMEREE